ncbi:MAG: hypothetical protein RLZZ519_2797, partial [Bacteroidota bacterium]
MKRKIPFRLAPLLFLAVIASCTSGNIKKTIPIHESTSTGANDKASGLPEVWLTQVQTEIAKREYAIQWQDDQSAFTSPNRQNNLRITYREDGFSLKPRVDSLANWHLDYTVSGLYREDECVLMLTSAPKLALCNETMEQDFGNGLHIQYVNSPQGMRQNFIVDDKPAGAGPLKVRLSSKGSLFPVKKGNGDVVMVEKNRVTGDLETRVWYKDLLVLDAEGKHVPASMQVNEPIFSKTEGEWIAGIELHVDDVNAAYPLLIDPLSTTAAISFESNQANAWFGYSVASAGDVNGDGYSDVVIGAPTYDNGQADQGAAYVYHGSATGLGT